MLLGINEWSDRVKRRFERKRTRTDTTLHVTNITQRPRTDNTLWSNIILPTCREKQLCFRCKQPRHSRQQRCTAVNFDTENAFKEHLNKLGH